MENTTTIIYTSNFANGKEIKESLIKHEIKFIEKNISNDISARNEIILKGFRKLPIIKINGDYVEASDYNILEIKGKIK